MDFNQMLSSSKNYAPKRLSFDFLNNTLGLSSGESEYFERSELFSSDLQTFHFRIVEEA